MLRRLADTPKLALALLLLAASPASAELYPTDACVGAKLHSAARSCEQLLETIQSGSGVPFARALQHVREQLVADWSAAEAEAAAQGAECAATSASAMADLLEAGARSIAGALESAERPGQSQAACVARAASPLAQSCRGLLHAYGRHLTSRDTDREQTLLSADLTRERGRLSTDLDRSSRQCPDSARSAAAGALEDLVAQALTAVTVSRNVPESFTEVVPDAEVVYRGSTLDPICSGGTPWSFWVRRGSVNKLVVYYQGGGACWNSFTCGGVPGFLDPTFKQATGPFDNPANFDSGFADRDNPANPFRDWHMVFVPYCTGDVHWGNAVVDHGGTTIRHKGWVNAQVAEKWAREHFVFPEQIFVTGSSAGAYGAIVNSLSLQEFAYPSTDFAVLGDAGNGVITQDFLVNDLAKWGLEETLPNWIPAFDVPITELDMAELYAESAKFYAKHRFATYTAAYDGGFGGQTGFYNIMVQPNVLDWGRWWLSSCEWNAIMRDLNVKAAATAPNFRFYVGTGSGHTMWGKDKVYTDTTGNVPTLRDWVVAMIEGSDDWVNVECDDCSTVLPGDPAPDPVMPPFTEDGRIVCTE